MHKTRPADSESRPQNRVGAAAVAVNVPACLNDLAEGRATIWRRPTIAARDDLPPEISPAEVVGAAQRMERFAPLLQTLFSSEGWDGRIVSELIALPDGLGVGRSFVKADHSLPMTGSIKARGGIHELLAYLEQIALDHGLLEAGHYERLASEQARAIFARHTVAVASTGNLGYSIGLVACALGLAAEIHMSHDAKAWKKERLRAIGATVVEYDGDYSETVSGARASVAGRRRTYFVDDENSRRLFTGYAIAAGELSDQLRRDGIDVTHDQPLVVYLPCGVGGAPGGITFGLKEVFGSRVICVFAEPVESACMMVAMAVGGGHVPSCYEFGLSNQTIADGLAVARASDLVVSAVGPAIDAVVAVTEQDMIDAMRWAWRRHGLRLEPAAAAAFAGRLHLRALDSAMWGSLEAATEVIWTTGGSRLPDQEFLKLLDGGPTPSIHTKDRLSAQTLPGGAKQPGT